jgi:site-specific recombinase XerD
MKLLDQVRQVLRVKRFALRTEQCYVRWIEQFIRFHKTAEGFRHPATLGAAEVEQFLTHLAIERHVSASTQNQALGALLFLYRDVLRLQLTGLDAVRARRSRRLPVVFSPPAAGGACSDTLLQGVFPGTPQHTMNCCHVTRDSLATP